MASTKNGAGSLWVLPPALTCFSCIASSIAAWVFGGVRLISSARRMLVKIGPSMNRKLRRPDSSSSRTFVPVMSEGIRSGVNCTRLKPTSRIRASVDTMSVLASPGTPSRRQWPRVKIAAKSCSMTSCCPTITFCSSSCISLRCWLNSTRMSSKDFGRGVEDTDQIPPWRAPYRRLGQGHFKYRPEHRTPQTGRVAQRFPYRPVDSRGVSGGGGPSPSSPPRVSSCLPADSSFPSSSPRASSAGSSSRGLSVSPLTARGRSSPRRRFNDRSRRPATGCCGSRSPTGRGRWRCGPTIRVSAPPPW